MVLRGRIVATVFLIVVFLLAFVEFVGMMERSLDAIIFTAAKSEGNTIKANPTAAYKSQRGLVYYLSR